MARKIQKVDFQGAIDSALEDLTLAIVSAPHDKERAIRLVEYAIVTLRKVRPDWKFAERA